MHFLSILFCSAAVFSCTQATTLFASSYDGSITTLSLTRQSGNYSLKSIYTNSDCAGNATWLTLDRPYGVLYCLNEGWTTTNGSLSSFTVNQNGSLNLIQRADTYGGPVNAVIYGDPLDKRALALAHYATTDGAVSSFSLNSTLGGFTGQQTIEFPLVPTGPDKNGRQAKPHAHQTILDPTGKFILVPDLGSDQVRVFPIISSILTNTSQTPLQVTPGHGPRHAVFYQPYGTNDGDSSSTFLYVVTEMGNTVESYNVSYPSTGGMAFTKNWESNVFGDPQRQPPGNAPAEIAISPDNRFLLISNRNDTINPQNFLADGKTASDSITTFALTLCGKGNFLQTAAVGGSWPRQFSINKYGNLVAVGLQYSQQVVILEREVQSGMIGGVVARLGIPGNVTGVWWWE